MARKNYLPFVQRMFLDLPGRLSTGGPSVAILTVGMGERLFLDDLNIHVVYPSNESFLENYIQCRMGYLGKGFLLEKRIPCGFFVNKGRPGCSTWKFPKPYRLKPTERLIARITPGTAAIRTHHQGIMFNGKRLDDGRPICLYDSTEAIVAAGVDTPMANDTLRAPEDTEIELYSVSVPDFVYATSGIGGATEADIRIWGPDRREWLKYEIQPAGAAIPAGLTAYSRWIGPPGSLIELGEDRGWVVDSNESMLLEFETGFTGQATVTAMVTLRGSLEVTNG